MRLRVLIHPYDLSRQSQRASAVFIALCVVNKEEYFALCSPYSKIYRIIIILFAAIVFDWLEENDGSMSPAYFSY